MWSDKNFNKILKILGSRFQSNSDHFWPMFPFFTPKIPENLLFSAIIREYKMGTLAGNGLILCKS